MCSFAGVKRKGLVLFTLLQLSLCASAQILDDSSKLVYGPTTTLRFSQESWMLNKLDTLPVDTTLKNLEEFAIYDQLEGKYQDLGNIGTALNPLFFQSPDFSGLRAGYHGYDPLVNSPEDLTYFDTKSPFIDLKVVLGGQGRSVIDVLYTQNVNPNWNIGFSVNRLNIDKQLGAVLNDGDRNLESSQMNLFSQYNHPKRPYRVLGYLNHFNHQVREVGGVYFTDSATVAEQFQYRDASILLADATAKDFRQQAHLYHSYGFFEFLEAYHQFDLEYQRLSYSDFKDDNTNLPYDTYRDFYPAYLIDQDSSFQKLNFRSVQNEVGVKGGEAIYYRLYAKQRQVKYDWLYLAPENVINELYIGGFTRFAWKDVLAVSANVELMNTGDYKIEGKLSSPFFSASYGSQLYQPTLLQTRYFGNHYEWNNRFNSTFINELKGEIRLKTGRFDIKPEANFTSLTNLVFFDTLALPQQTNGTLLSSRLGLSTDFRLMTNVEDNESFIFENTAYFSEVSGDEKAAFPIPQWLINSRWYWEGKWFQNSTPIEIGFNFHFKSGYYARSYRPELQQFHVQNHDFIGAYFTIDPFISMKVNKVFVFAKMTHVNMLPGGGYFITPRYPGQERIFDFGVRWIFFD